MTEKKLQAEILRWIRSQGAYAIKTQPGAGVPVGCPDIIFMFEGFWGALEVKASEKSKFQPLQRITIERLDGWSYCRAVYPTNWADVQVELKQQFF